MAKVELTNDAGALIEAGAAVEEAEGSGRFAYTAQAAIPAGTSVRITVTAGDLPGHTTTQSGTWS